jgi:hypothetical protein
MSKLVTVVPILRNQYTYSVVGVRPQKALNAQLAAYVGNRLVEMDQPMVLAPVTCGTDRGANEPRFDRQRHCARLRNGKLNPAGLDSPRDSVLCWASVRATLIGRFIGRVRRD